jgi:hypothetical protein
VAKHKPRVWTAKQLAKWKRAIGELRRECVGPVPIKTVRRCKLVNKTAGLCHQWPTHCSIYINNNLDLQAALDTLIHEWAHVLVSPINLEHGPAWGVAYAHCYRTVLEHEETSAL